jgi:tRNA dimethylallyltransferase
MALDAMEEIYDNGRIPMVVGGTGFYIQALLYDVAFCDNDDDMSYRQELGRIADKQGGEYLHHMLAQVDPASAQSIHPNNIKRVIRALEFYKKTGKPISEHNQEERARTSPYNFVYFVLTNNREVLYERIDRRVDMMLEQGLVDEVKALMNDGYNKNLTSMQGLGYKEIIDYLNGDISYEDAVYILKRDTRHFAKRQLTWFKREKEVTWVDKHTLTDDEQVMDFMLQQLRNKQIIGD